MQKKGIHTAIETCGFVQRDMLEEILEATDLVIFDLKHMDAAKHERFVGTSNELILKNLEMIAEQNREVLVRIPLIPGINDTDKNLQESAEFLKGLGIEEVEVIPYHEFASTKYELLGVEYDLKDLEPYTPEQLDSKKRVMAKFGMCVKIGV